MTLPRIVDGSHSRMFLVSVQGTVLVDATSFQILLDLDIVSRSQNLTPPSTFRCRGQSKGIGETVPSISS